MDDLTLNLLNILDNDRDFLNYCLDSNKEVSYAILSKLMNGKLDITDLDNYEFIEFKYFKIFKDDVLMGLLNKDFEITDSHYCCINVDNLCKEYLPNIDYVNKIRSFVFDKELFGNEYKLLSVELDKVSYEKDNISILMPVNDYNIVNKNVFDNYINTSVKLQKGTIVIIGYNKFINLTDKEKDLLKDCVVILDNDYKSLDIIRKNFIYKYDNFNNYNNDFSENIIRFNHILYLINNSSLSDIKKSYYRYYIKNNYFNKRIILFDLYELVSQFVLEVDNEYINRMTDKFNGLPFYEKIEKFTEDEYTIDVFLASIENKPIKFILKKISSLSDSVRCEFLNNETIKKILREGIINESKGNPWGYIRDYDGLLNFLSVPEIFSLFDGNFLEEAKIKKLIDDKNDKFEYVLYASLTEKDINKTFQCVLKDEKLYKYYFDKLYMFCGILLNVDYDLLVELIYRMEKKGNYFINYFTIDKMEQYKLLKESFNDNTLIKLVSSFDVDVKTFFFMNDERALRLWKEFPLVQYSNKGVLLSDKILNSQEFFEQLKSDSLINFRRNINSIYKCNYFLKLDDRVDEYYNSILENFDYNSGVFYQYLRYDDNIKYKSGNEFILGGVDSFKLGSFKYIDELKNITNIKVSEVVIDGLFKDNIYNVFLNIKEMLRYNEHLSITNKVLDNDSVKFYNTILNIDKIKPLDKINLYYKLKDKKIDFKYYDDIRKLKDLSYNNIKNDMFKLKEHSNYINDNLSKDKGVLIYDLRDKEYIMLIRCMNNFKDKSSIKRNCYSLIGNTNTSMFSLNGFVYGYSDFDNDCVLHVFEGDSFSLDLDSSNVDNNDSTSYPNRIATSDEVINSVNWYSEIQIVNKKDKNRDIFDVMIPDFLVCVDEIKDKDIMESKRMNIPIVLIKSNKLNKSMNYLKFDGNIYEKYVTRNDDYYDEQIRKQYR